MHCKQALNNQNLIDDFVKTITASTWDTRIDCRTLTLFLRRGGPMEKEYISTIVIDSESAANDWPETPDGKRHENSPAGSPMLDQETEFSGVHTWVS